jgi:hypothetical protein
LLAPTLAPGVALAAIAMPLLILAHAAKASKEKEIARGSTGAATSGDDSFLGGGGVVLGAGTTSAAAPEDPEV